MDNLKGRNWDNLIVDVQNMTWSPIHVTQRLQESRVEFDRAVLIGCKTYSKEPGTIECYKWSMKNRNNKLYVSSYEGDHYNIFGESNLKVRLLESNDGINFNEISKAYQYIGGVSEVAFEFDEKENFWAVSRNEDGDKSGFGSHLIFANSKDISKWDIINQSNKI